MQIPIEKIIVPKGRRPLDQEKVAEIAASIEDIGLLSPIGVRSLDSKTVEFTQGKVELVFGAHRLAACQQLGHAIIDVVEIDSGVGDNDAYSRLAEIAENLFRADLTIQQRNEHLAMWVEWREKFGLTPISGSESPISSKPGRKPSHAVAAAAKMTGLTTKTVKRAIKTTKVRPEVKAAADAAELSSKQRLAVARLAKDQQLDAVAEIAADNRFRAEAKAKAEATGDALDETLSRYVLGLAPSVIGRFADFCKQNHPATVAGGVLENEVVDLMSQVATIDAWLGTFAVMLDQHKRAMSTPVN
jgi:ParB family chromosome partitioning protein